MTSGGSPVRCHPGPPQIRTCGFPASGSSRDGLATRGGSAPHRVPSDAALPSLAAPVPLPVQVSWRCGSSTTSRSSFPPTVPSPGAALCSAGSLGTVPRLPCSYCGAPISCAPGGLCFRSCLPVPPHGGDAGPPKFPGDPRSMPRTSTPVGPRTVEPIGLLALSVARGCAFHGLDRVGSYKLCVSRLQHRPACSLSTLRGHGYPCAAHGHARLASGWGFCLFRSGFEPAGSLREVSEMS
jgi:hypothetical protein